MKMFGTNGIRGIANEDLDCEKALQVGKSISKVLGSGTIAIAMDARVSSDMIRSSVSAGILSMGTDLHYLGIVPTPALQYYVKTHSNISGGVMITASHNPPEFNGIKCISFDGTECSSDEESRIEDYFDEELHPVSWEKIGSETLISDAGLSYVDAVISKIDVDAVRNAKLTVCLDCANGAACDTTPLLLKKIGVNVITINSNPDGRFPGHPSEPVEKNLTQLKNLVREIGADLGAAHDGDADRCMFVDDKGRFVGGDIALALMCGLAVSSSDIKSAVTTVASSSIIEDVVRANGGVVSYTAVGSPKVARRMMEDGSPIGGEENGGFIFADHQYCRDGAMCISRMIEFISKNGSLADKIDSLPRYYTIKAEAFCSESFKSMMEDEIKRRHTDGKINTIDGLRIDYDDGWVLLRASGTEPKFRIYSESKDPAVAEERSRKFKEEFDDIYRNVSA